MGDHAEMKWFWISLSLVAGCSAACCAGDYTVTRSVTIQSQRPIWLLICEMGLGVLDVRSGSDSFLSLVEKEAIGRPVSTRLSIDGRPAPGIGGLAQAAWRLGAFVLWDADGTVERTTYATVRGHSVFVRERILNGRVWLRVVVGPPLGDPRVRYAVLELTGAENGNRTRIQLSCSAVINLPGNRCRLVRRISRRIADREAGAELAARVNDLLRAGSGYTYAGRERLIHTFLRETCHQ